MTPVKHDLIIRKGRTFSEAIRLSQSTITYKPITAASKSAPCTLTVPLHGLTAGWPFQIRSVLGMTELNNVVTASNDEDVPTKWGRGANGRDNYSAVVVGSNTLELNDVNALDFAAYSSGGVVVYQPPLDLTIYASARMQVRDSVESATVLQSFVFGTHILIDVLNKKIVLQMDALASAALTWEQGVYDLELITATGEVDCPIYGTIKVAAEVTR